MGGKTTKKMKRGTQKGSLATGNAHSRKNNIQKRLGGGSKNRLQMIGIDLSGDDS